MTAQAVGFVSRAEAGLRPPRSVSRRITPEQGGSALHYGGPPQRITSHAGCLRTWRSWQTYHMDGHGWSDIAYTLGVCDHGYVLAGRGAGVRTAANGTNAGNDDYYAVVWLGGKGEQPTQLALDAVEWAVLSLRLVDANTRVRPHQVFTGSECPGVYLINLAGRLDRAHIGMTPTPTPAPAPTPTPAPAPAPTVEVSMAQLPLVRPGDGMPPAAPSQAVRNVQGLLMAHRHDLSQEGGMDGRYGAGLRRELEAFQRARGLRADGIVGEDTWTRLCSP